MKIVRTLVVEMGSDRERVQRKISASGSVEETGAIDGNRILVKMWDQTISGLKQKERSIRNTDGVKGCTILKTQYMP